MKRTLSLLLALALTATLAVPALASETDLADEYAIDTMMPAPGEEPVVSDVPEESVDRAGLEAELTDLILRTKTTLEVDNNYTDLTSDYYDGVTPRWSFTWSDDVRQMTAEVRQDGTILNAYYWENSEDDDYFYGFDPVFPPLTPDEAGAQAEDWFDRLFVGEESARVDGVQTVLGKDGCYRYEGTVEKNGLPSPVTFTLVINGGGLSSFFRSDSYTGYVGRLPAAEPGVEAEQAAASLAGTVAMDLYYVSDGEGGAALRYVPVGPYTVVDAQSGETVDMDALYASFGGVAAPAGAYGRGAEVPAAEAVTADSGAVITEAEQTSIGQYGDVLDGSAIDRQLRTLNALGLEVFQLQRCSYSMDSETGLITADLRYVTVMTAEQLYGFSPESFQQMQSVGGDLTVYKRITTDAKTGALKSVSTTYPLWEKDEGVTMTDTVRTQAAENFIGLAAPDLAAEAALCTLSGVGGEDTLVFAQTHEGYYFPENRITVAVNAGSGTIDSFSVDWDEDVTFGPADKVIAPEKAAAAYTDALDVTLGYVAWPLDITLEENAAYAALLAQGYTYVEELRLAYVYDGKDAVSGVDAVTGEAVLSDGTGETAYEYDDLEGVAQAEQIQALAQAGVGFAGGRFRPEEELTCQDAATLLILASGSQPAGDRDSERMALAVRQGFVTEEEWQANETLTRMDFIRMLLRPSRYGDAAELLSVEADRGYSVIALALGMDVSDPDGTATRADAAAMLYRFMSR